MYDLPVFKEKDPAVILDFIRQHPFAMMIGCDAANRPVATQVPVFLEEKGGKFYLSGHMMRNTDHHKAFTKNAQVLCIFSGPHTYVSATWYEDPHQASTWNYLSVHARGKIHFLGEAELSAVLQKTSLYFEGGNEASSTVYQNLPEDYRNRLIKAIVAFEVEVEEVNHVFKLSQNRDQKSYQNIIEKLETGKEAAVAVAAAMKRKERDLFSE